MRASQTAVSSAAPGSWPSIAKAHSSSGSCAGAKSAMFACACLLAACTRMQHMVSRMQMLTGWRRDRRNCLNEPYKQVVQGGTEKLFGHSVDLTEFAKRTCRHLAGAWNSRRMSVSNIVQCDGSQDRFLWQTLHLEELSGGTELEARERIQRVSQLLRRQRRQPTLRHCREALHKA